MKAFWKNIYISSLCLLCIVLPGCHQQAAEAYDAPETVAPSAATIETVTPGPTAHIVPVTPIQTFTPTPTPTPEPTPTPTPTSVPMDRRDCEGEVREVLFPLWAEEPAPTPTVEPHATADPRAEAMGKLCAMLFANVPIYEKPKETAEVLGRESYHLVYVHTIHRDFYYVTTQEGLKGYVKISSVTPLSDVDLELYLSAAMELAYTAAPYSPDAFVEEVMGIESAGDMEERVYEALCRLGVDFEPFYYRVYKKDLKDVKKYPHYYRDEVYNSLLFKLYNSTGSLASYNGHRTQWEYVPAGGALQKGDILFFSELPKRSNGLVPECEFVIAGQHSGNVTECAVYLGDDSVLRLKEGRVERMDNFSASPLFQSFDSARRIHLEVFDEKQMIIEDMIAQAYDCLGTPYNSFRRTGDFSFDCSGLISWLLVRLELYPKGYVYYKWIETSASGLSNITDYIWHGEKQVHLTAPVPQEKGQTSLEDFERGDIVFLRGSPKGGAISHVMIYLGDGRVIHSTVVTKSKTYSGTAVANFRQELQRLYCTSLRIESITSPES